MPQRAGAAHECNLGAMIKAAFRISIRHRYAQRHVRGELAKCANVSTRCVRGGRKVSMQFKTAGNARTLQEIMGRSAADEICRRTEAAP